MINGIIRWSLQNRFIVLAAFLALCAWGVVALQRVPIDAIPDLSENQVIVYADWPGRSPQEVEDQITYRLSVTLQGLAGVKVVRATSMFGFSFLTVIFEDKIDPYFALPPPPSLQGRGSRKSVSVPLSRDSSHYSAASCGR